MNDRICPDLTSVVYASVDNAVEIISRLGLGIELVKMDLKDAYRVIPVHQQDHHFLGIQWCGDTFVDRSLPFDLWSTPNIFTAFLDMVVWAIHHRGVHHLLHYLDNFLLFGQLGTLEAGQAVATAQAIFAEAGILVAEHKTEGPATSVTFLGILVDTVQFQLRLPADKLARLQVIFVSDWTAGPVPAASWSFDRPPGTHCYRHPSEPHLLVPSVCSYCNCYQIPS